MARTYKKNRVSRKGLTPYDIYLRKRSETEEKGFTIRPAMSKEDFNKLYSNAKKAGVNNFFRDLANAERYVDRPQFYRMRKELRQLETEDQEVKEWKERMMDISWENFKTWNNEDWSSFFDILIANGGTWEEARGIYES